MGFIDLLFYSIAESDLSYSRILFHPNLKNMDIIPGANIITG